MKKEVAISDFVDELLRRIDASNDINCCQEELKTFCNHVVAKLGDDKIEIEWKSSANSPK